MHTKKFRGMSYRRLGRSGLWASEVGLGLWKWGDPTYDGARVGEHAGYQILDRAVELGATHWDTANSYNMGAGNSERLLGRYFASRGSHVRSQVILATKVNNSVRDEHVLSQDFSPNQSGASRRYILQAVDDCLRRLQTEWIDVLYHHVPGMLEDGSWETPLEETWDAFNILVSQGKVRYLAVSNRTVEQLEQESQALAAVAANPARRIVAVQNPYNLLQRAGVSALEAPTLAGEQAFLSYTRREGIGVVPYFPLAVGLLAGRYRKGNLGGEGRLSEASGEGLRDEFLNERNLDLVEKLITIAQAKGCTLAQLAIAWLLSHEEVCSVIAGVTKMEHLEDNVGAVGVSLTLAELESLDQLTK